jgi:hypothetical protein
MVAAALAVVTARDRRPSDHGAATVVEPATCHDQPVVAWLMA